MYLRMCQFLSSLITNPVFLCLGFVTFLSIIVGLLNLVIHVDADGKNFAPSVNLHPGSPVDNELNNLTRDYKWKEDPKTATRVKEIMESPQTPLPVTAPNQRAEILPDREESEIPPILKPFRQ